MSLPKSNPNATIEPSAPSISVQDVPLEPNHCSVKTERVIIFKSGFCLFVKALSGRPADPNNPFVWCDAVPDNACLGTFWTIPCGNTVILNTQSSKVETVERTVETVHCKERLELLAQNIGKEISVRVMDPYRNELEDPISREPIVGILKDLLYATETTSADTETQDKDKPMLDYTHLNRRVQVYRAGQYRGPSSGIVRENHGLPTFIVVTTPDGFDRVISTHPCSSSKSLGLIDFSIKDMKTTKKRTVITKSTQKRLSINFAKSPNNPIRSFKLIYLSPGIRWIPTYRVALTSDSHSEDAESETNETSNSSETSTETSNGTDTPDSKSKPRSPRSSPRSSGGLFSKIKKAVGVETAPVPPPTSMMDIPLSGARLALQALVLNEVENLDDCTIDFVVGIAKFKQEDQISPMALSNRIHNALLAAESSSSRPSLRQGNRNILQPPMQMQQMQMQQMQMPPPQLMSNALYQVDSSASSAPSFPTPEFDLGDIETSSGSDLFVYSAHNVSIAKGSRVAVPLIVESSELPFRNFYTWDVSLTSRATTLHHAEANNGDLHVRNVEVWHKIALTNNTKVPFTTGPVLVTQGDSLLPLTQELMYYTAPGTSVTIPLTQSINTRAYIVSTEEIKRKLKSLKIGNDHYCRIDKRSILSVKNNHPFPIFIDIKIKIGGHADSVSDNGNISITTFNSSDWTGYSGSSSANNSSTIGFNSIKIGPGKEFRPTIKYHYFVLQSGI